MESYKWGILQLASFTLLAVIILFLFPFSTYSQVRMKWVMDHPSASHAFLRLELVCHFGMSCQLPSRSTHPIATLPSRELGGGFDPNSQAHTIPIRYLKWSVQFSSVRSLHHVRLFVTPWTAACQASLSLTNSQSLLKLVHWVRDAIQPSHPLSSPSPPTFNLSQHQGLFKWVSSSHQVAKVLEFQLQQQSFQWIFRTVFL